MPGASLRRLQTGPKRWHVASLDRSTPWPPAAGRVWVSEASPREVTSCPARPPFYRSSPRPCRGPNSPPCPFWRATSGAPNSLCAFQLREWFACARSADSTRSSESNEHTSSSTSVTSASGAAVRGYVRFAPHRWPHHRRPSRLCAATQDPLRRVAHPRTRPPRADPFPPCRPDHHRAPRRARLPARHQRPARLRSRRRADRDYADTLRGHRVLDLVGKGNKPATMPPSLSLSASPSQSPLLRALEACRGQRTTGPPPKRASAFSSTRSGSGRSIRLDRTDRLVVQGHDDDGLPRLEALVNSSQGVSSPRVDVVSPCHMVHVP